MFYTLLNLVSTLEMFIDLVLQVSLRLLDKLLFPLISLTVVLRWTLEPNLRLTFFFFFISISCNNPIKFKLNYTLVTVYFHKLQIKGLKLLN